MVFKRPAEGMDRIKPQLFRHLGDGEASAQQFKRLLEPHQMCIRDRLNMFSNAVRPVEEMFDPEVIWIPKTFTLDNIKTALARMNILNPPFQNNAIVLSLIHI